MSSSHHRVKTHHIQSVIIVVLLGIAVYLWYTTQQQQEIIQGYLDPGAPTEYTNTSTDATPINTTQEPNTAENSTDPVTQYGFWISTMSRTSVDTQKLSDGSVVYNFSDTNSVTNLPASSKEMLSGSYGSGESTEFTVNGVRGEDITGHSAKDGSEIRYLVLYQGERIFVVQGDDSFLNEAKKSIIFQ